MITIRLTDEQVEQVVEGLKKQRLEMEHPHGGKSKEKLAKCARALVVINNVFSELASGRDYFDAQEAAQ